MRLQTIPQSNEPVFRTGASGTAAQMKGVAWQGANVIILLTSVRLSALNGEMQKPIGPSTSVIQLVCAPPTAKKPAEHHTPTYGPVLLSKASSTKMLA